jgi:hypothetical protein
MWLSIPTVAAFAALTLALAALWAPHVFASSRAARVWTLPCALALAAALVARLIDIRSLFVLLSFGGVCATASRADGRTLRIVAHTLMLIMCAGLFLHVIPGFDNPRVVTNAVLGRGSQPYTEYLNFDKGVAGLFLLGIYASDRPASDEGLRHGVGFLWRFVVLVTVAIALSLALGYVRWDPKLPPWWPMWTWSMIFLTALPEEALFRAVAQSSIETWLGGTPSATTIAIVTAGVLFGVAHLAGGFTYVLLAAVAGMGYGWIYASTRSIAAAIIAHAGLNTVHFLFFSYPALATSGAAV